MDIFKYRESDYIYDVVNKDVLRSKFEEILEKGWRKAMNAGLFRYSLDNIKTRIVMGEKCYILQLNEKRMIERRKPETFLNPETPFEENKFNFTKVKPEEILFKIEKIGNESSKFDGNHIILINVSPLEQNHILLVPNIDKYIPQKLDIVAIHMAVELMLLSSNPAWRIGFNSLCALASVNHQHLHAWTLEHKIYLQDVKVTQLGNSDIHVLQDKCIKAFAFQLYGSTVNVLSRNVFSCVKCLQTCYIPHNLFMTRGVSFHNDLINTVRIFIFPRKPFNGCKLSSGRSQPFNVACAELSGHIPVYNYDAFERLTEKEIDEIIGNEMIPEDEFGMLMEKVETFSP